MFPELFSINLPILGELTVTSFGAFMAAAFFVGYFVVRLETKRLDLGAEVASEILLGALIGGIVGAKIYYVLLYWDRTVVDPFGMLFSRAGLVWYGGLIGGFLGVVWVLRRKRVATGLGADAVSPALALSYAIGRLGCFFVGDDYGRPTNSALRVAFPNGQPPSTADNLRRFGVEVDPALPDGQVLAVHPTQLYETGLSLGVFFLLWRLRAHTNAPGWLFGVWLALAGAARFAIEWLRAKDDRLIGQMTVAQVISVLVVVAGVALIVRLRQDRGGVGASS